jgi:uncharacterized protein YhjY with autotransporter beta-barrel domain
MFRDRFEHSIEQSDQNGAPVFCTIFQAAIFQIARKLTGIAASCCIVLLLGLMPYSEGWASTTPTTTSGNAATGASNYVTYGCTGCHTNPISPYPSQENAANSGSLVHYMNTTLGMGSSTIPTAAIENNIAAYIATFVTIPTTVSTAYNTTSASTATYITLGAASYPTVITAIGTVSSPTKGSVTFSTGTTPYVPTFTYAPSSGACGSDSFTYGALGLDSTSSRSISVTIANPPVPTITSGVTATGMIGVSSTQYSTIASSTQSASLCGATRFSATAVAYGGAYTTTTTGWPAGVSLNTSTGVISGTPTAAGTYNITVYAINPGGASTGKAITFTVNMGNQTISLGSAPTVVVAGTGSVSATATSGLGVTYSSNTPSACSVNAGSGLVTGIAAGTNNCTIAANQAGNANWNAATQATQTFSIGKGSQTISFGAAPTVVYSGTGTANATATSGLAVSYSTASPGCSVNAGSGLVTGIAAGTNNCTIAANQVGNINYNAATQVTQTFSIGKVGQSISFGAAPTVTVGGSGTSSATATSGLAVSYSTSTPSYCSVNSSSGLVSGLATGTCTIAADQAGNTNYSAATQATQNIAVGLKSQTISFGAAPTVVYGGTGTVSATASPSGYAVTYGTTTAGACSVNSSSGLVTGLAAGTNNCTITANQAGDSIYAAATQATQTFSIGKVGQSISFGAAPTVAAGGSGTSSATATSGLAVSYSTSTPSYCSVNSSSGLVSGLATGTCTIAANQAGNTNYSAATQVTQNISIGKGSQTITFGAAPSVAVGATGTTSASATSSLSVSYSSTTPATCSVNASSGLVTGIAAGTNNCTIAANQTGDANWNAATQVTQTFSIGQTNQSITFGAVPTVTLGGSGTVSATGGASGNAVTFTSTTTGVCTVSGTNGSMITGVTAGICTIAANQAGNTNYTAATQVTQNITIGQSGQSISFSAAPTVLVGGTGTVSATGGGSGNAVTFTSTTTGVCTVSGANGSTVTGVAAGTCTIAANQAGNTNYTAATQATQNITVSISVLPPVANAVSMAVPLNTPTTLDLLASHNITGSGVTGVSIVTTAAHGTVTVSGTNVTYTPVHNYFGADTFSYVAFGSGGASSSGVVTVKVADDASRPDPTKDVTVTGLLTSEGDTAQRFSSAQIANFQHRMESLHRGSSDGTSTSSGFSADTSRIAGATAAEAANRQQLDGGSITNASPMLRVAYAQAASNMSDPVDGERGFKSVQLENDIVSLLTTQSVNLSMSEQGAGAASATGIPNFWVEGIANFGTRDATSSQNGLDFTTSGISIGVDRRFSDKLAMGVGVGFARDKTDIGTDGSYSHAHGSSITVYGSYQPTGNTFVDGLIGYGSLSFETKRYVDAVNDFAYGERDGYQVFSSIATGYEYRDEGQIISPYARLDYSVDHLNQSTETGAGLNALTYFSQVTPSVQGALGIRAEARHETTFGSATPSIRAEYRHDFQGEPQASMAYADLINGLQYTFATETIVRNSFALGIGDDFVMHDGLSIGIDYQLMHAISSSDVSQSITVRVSKDLDKRWGLESSSLKGIQVDAGYMFDDNVTRSKESADKLSDQIYSVNMSKVGIYPETENSRVLLSGSLGGEKFRDYDGLSHVTAGVQGEYQYRGSAEFGTPIYAIFTKAYADQYKSSLRDGYHYTAGISVRDTVTDRIRFFSALAHNVRNSTSAVFDTQDNSARLNLDYSVTPAGTLYLGDEIRRGDVVSTGSASLENIDTAKVFVQDDAFPGGQMFSYRFDGKTVLMTLGYNIGFGPRDAIDFSWRRVQSTPDWRPTYATSPSSYIANQYSIVYLGSF